MDSDDGSKTAARTSNNDDVLVLRPRQTLQRLVRLRLAQAAHDQILWADEPDKTPSECPTGRRSQRASRRLRYHHFMRGGWVFGSATSVLLGGHGSGFSVRLLDPPPERADCGRGRSVRRSRSDDPAVPVARGRSDGGRAYARGHGCCHGHDRWAAFLEDGAAPRSRSPRSRLLHRPGKRQGPGAAHESICRCPLPLVPAGAPTGPGDRSSGGGRRRPVGRLLAVTAAGCSSERRRQLSERSRRESSGARRSGSRVGRGVPRRIGSTAASPMGRLPDPA